ncbi:MAG TPA: hypothetical protein VJG64_04800 [Candidatus Paceibacterota bacterium]
MKDMLSPSKMALKATRWIGSPNSLFIHTILFILSFAATLIGFVSWDKMLLIVTTIVSLEAIYLAIFIQMSVNLATASIEEVEQDIDEIQEDVGEIQEDVDEIQKDVDELQEDVEEIAEEGDEDDVAQQKTLADIQADLRKLVQDIEKLQQPKA